VVPLRLGAIQRGQNLQLLRLLPARHRGARSWRARA
jgi:hypothetical protein